MIKLFDLFSLRQFLRYKQDEDYQTVSGGVTSLLVVSVFGVLFASNAITTVNKSDVKWEQTTLNSFEPVTARL